MRHSRVTSRVDDREFKKAVEEALLFEELSKSEGQLALFRESGPVSREHAPRLSVVHPTQARAAHGGGISPGTRTATTQTEPARTESREAASAPAALRYLAPEESRPAAGQATAPQPTSAPAADVARQGAGQPGHPPRRIGRGLLVPARLTWKPGDPFGGEGEHAAESFRWDAMLTSACVTAVSGLVFIWLLRSVLQ